MTTDTKKYVRIGSINFELDDLKGWSPILAVVNDGDRCVLQITNWTGGVGTKPATGQYLGVNGLVDNIADGTDIRGLRGSDGGGLQYQLNGVDIGTPASFDTMDFIGNVQLTDNGNVLTVEVLGTDINVVQTIEPNTETVPSSNVLYNFALDVANEFNSKADLDSPVFTGNPTAPTPNSNNNSDTVATTAFVNNFIALQDFEQKTNKATNLATPDNTTYPTTQAAADGDTQTLADANAYAESLVVGLWDDRGNFDASGGAYPTTGGSGTGGAVLKGDIWTISVAGTLPVGQIVEIGDTVRALVDNPAQTQANWAIAQNNIGYVPENQANKVNDLTDSTSTTKYTSVKSVVDALALKQNALTDIVTAGTYGSSTQIPVITITAKGFVDDVTLVNVSGGGDTIVNASSGTVTLSAGVNYRILVSGSFTLDVSAQTGTVQIINVTAVQYTITLSVGSKVVSDLVNTSISSFAVNAFSMAFLAPNPNVANSIRMSRPVQVSANDILISQNNSNASGNKISWSAPTISASRSWTLPDKNINFGDLGFVASTNSNTLSGNRTRIYGGSGNTVSGVDNVLVGCTDATASSGIGQLLLGVRGTAVPIDWPVVGIQGGILNSAAPPTSQLTEIRTALRADNIGAVPVVLTTDGAAPTATNTPKAAMLYGSDIFGGANHILELQIFCIDTSILFSVQGNVARTHRISVLLNGGVYTTAIDAGSSVVAGAGYTISVTVAEVGGRLQISLSHSSGAGKHLRVKALLRSHYNYIQ